MSPGCHPAGSGSAVVGSTVPEVSVPAARNPIATGQPTVRILYEYEVAAMRPVSSKEVVG